jgi:DNA-directed RNA polymerase subunit omega
VPWENDKPTVVALREIAAGNVGPAILDEVEQIPEEEPVEQQPVVMMDAEDPL